MQLSKMLNVKNEPFWLRKLLALLILCCFPNVGLTTEDATEELNKVAFKIAREILMVDENNQSLKGKYEGIIQEAFSKPIRSPQSKKDVLILGAGIAGLLAGKILQHNDYRVTILEANGNRIGGRIKTFHNEKVDEVPPLYMARKEPPFLDINLYAEAGAMRIPSSHPLVMTLINALQLQTQDFYNIDVKRDDPAQKANNTWVCANGVQERAANYASEQVSEDKRYLKFPLPEKYNGRTAKSLLDQALEPLNAQINPAQTPTVDGQVKAWAEIIKKYDKYSMLEYLQEHYPERVAIDYIGTLQNLSSRLFLSFMHSFVDTFYINPGTVYKEIRGGNYKLPYDIAQSLGRKNIVMNARAIEIQWSSDKYPASVDNKNTKATNRGKPGVYVRTVGERVNEDDNKLLGHSMDREFTADYLITSIPFSALRFVEVQPRFSYGKHRAITELHYDSATKIFLEFSERFWEWNEKQWQAGLSDEYRGHNSIGGGTITDSPNRFIYYPTNFPKESRGGVILASYTWADEANRWDSILPEDRVYYALRGLTDIYGKGILRFFTGKSKTESWMQNPYAYGEAAVFTPGQIIGLYPNTSTPEGPIHFAGEHTSMKHAWIEGAIESAVRVALEIMERDKSEEKVSSEKEISGENVQ